MQRRGLLVVAAAAVAAVAGLVWLRLRPKSLSEPELAARYAQPLPAPEGALKVFHLGHSLVGRDMPAMLAQMAQAAGLADHAYNSQLGWGASLDQHRRGDVPGFAEENGTAAFRAADEALASGEYGAVVVTEMVEIRDAVKWHDSAAALAHWARAARAGNPQVRVYLYETWHKLDDPEGWLERIDADLARHWKADLLRPAMADPAVGTIYVVPGGQVLAAAVRAVEAGQVPELTSREDFMARTPEGTVDPIHLNDRGNWLVAMVHFAVLYHRSPEGTPYQLAPAYGSSAVPVPESAVPVLQKLVWDVVRRYPESGVPPT